MRRPRRADPAWALVVAGVALAVAALGTVAAGEPASGAPAASIDLTTPSGVSLVKGVWRWHDVQLVPAKHRAPDAEGQPTGAPIDTWDYAPRAGGADFEDSEWEAVAPTELSRRRGNGRLCFGWYRIRITVPEKIGGVSTAGGELVFRTTLDDYAEIWVDGEIPRAIGQRGGSVVAGWNASNRLTIARRARPGQEIQLAIFAANGPLSDPPANFLWVREARLDLYPEGPREPEAIAPAEVNLEIETRDPRLTAIVPANPKAWKLAEGFDFTEGPVWAPGRGLLFSDPNRNRIYRYTEDGTLSVFREQSGYDGADVEEYRQPGSNGLTLDPDGRLLVNEHGRRRVVRIEQDGGVTVLADRDAGRRLNSPNDLVTRSDGLVYFTDPPFGLPKLERDPRKELPYSGVYLWRDGTLTLETKELTGPNGIAFSPDEHTLYVGNWDEKRKVVMRYDVAGDGALSGARVFADLTAAPGEDAVDGVKVDVEGNVYVSGPGGLWIFAPDGTHLGTIRLPQHPHNFAWGDEDGRTLYVCARSGLYKLRLGIAGFRPPLRRIVRLDPRFDAAVPPASHLELVAGGFDWVEGPVWRASARSLLFSDVRQGRIYEWRDGEERPRVVVTRSGDPDATTVAGIEPGSNGLALDAQERLLVAQHGGRRLVRLEPGGARTVLADRYEGRRFNSPNDLVRTDDGAIWFTDPPFGLPRSFDDPARELPFSGVYRLDPRGAPALLTRALHAPNGLALLDGGRTLLVSNADRRDPVWLAFRVARSGGAQAEARVLADARDLVARFPGAPDGMKVDGGGRIWAAGPGGVHLLAADGTRLGSILTGVATANLAFAHDGAVYVAAGHGVYRLRRPPRS